MKRVRVALGRTISLKQYESLRVDVAIENEGDHDGLYEETLQEAKDDLNYALQEAKRDCA